MAGNDTEATIPEIRQSLALLIQAQVADFTAYIARGEFPLVEHYLHARWHLVPGAKAALERIDALWLESVKNNSSK